MLEAVRSDLCPDECVCRAETDLNVSPLAQAPGRELVEVALCHRSIFHTSNLSHAADRHFRLARV